MKPTPTIPIRTIVKPFSGMVLWVSANTETTMGFLAS